ncbi:MAG TPA: hypothetical protein VGO46_00325 [Gemmatimonadaceae bacterium]|jgi:hypothetical protein|nr:hypothetical protein [Gemmatimonadaceae bacterium]
MPSRFTNVLCAAALATTLIAVRVRAQAEAQARSPGVSPQEMEFRQGLSPEGWAKGADGMEKCTVSALAADAIQLKWKTDSLEGVVSLPKDFREEPPKPGVEGNRWVAADSSSFEIRGTHALYRGNMGLGGMDIGRPLGTTTCALTLESRAAPSHSMRLTRPVHGDTLNVDTPNTVIRNGVGLQFIILTHTPAREAELLAAAQSIKVTPGKTP